MMDNVSGPMDPDKKKDSNAQLTRLLYSQIRLDCADGTRLCSWGHYKEKMTSLKKAEAKSLGKISANVDNMKKFLGPAVDKSKFDPDTDCFVLPQVDGTNMTSMNKHIFVCSKVSFTDFEVFQNKLSLAIDLYQNFLKRDITTAENGQPLLATNDMQQVPFAQDGTVQPIALFLWGDRVSGQANFKEWIMKKNVIEIAQVELEDKAKVATAEEPQTGWTAKDTQNALVDNFCMYLKIPKVGLNASDDSEYPIICANSKADMNLFKDYINSNYMRYNTFSFAEKVKANIDNENCDSINMKFFKQRLARIIGYAKKRFDYYKANSRTLQKDTEDTYVSEEFALEIANISTLLNLVPITDKFNACSAKIKEDALTADALAKLSFIQTEHKSKYISKSKKTIGQNFRFTQTGSKSKLKAKEDVEKVNAVQESKKALESSNKIKRLPKAIMPLDFQCADKEVDMFVCFLNWLSNNYIPKDFDDEFAFG